MVHIVGAGPGSVDLLTVRAQRLLQEADVIIYTGSLVNPELLTMARENAAVYDSAGMTLEEVMAVMEEAEQSGLSTVRLHTGDPCIYGAVREQMDWMDGKGIPYDICPGVSSFCGAAAALGMEYTLPDVTQSVIITRMAGRTPVPAKESIRGLAAHNACMVVFLSAGMAEELAEELMAGGYDADTSAAIVYRATWPDERVIRCTVGTLGERAREEGITKTALIIAGDSVAQSGYMRSKLYNPSFSTMFRTATVSNTQESGDSGRGAVCAAAPDYWRGQGEESGGFPIRKSGKRPALYVVGIGPGALELLTPQASKALRESQVIVGYTVYVDLIKEHFPGKEFLATAMTREEERCRRAFECCLEGKDTAIVCSGDPGVYGMAGLVLELSRQYPDVAVEVIPGVTAACAGAALLGAPLMHDFTVISLSDRLTPLELIWERVEAAAKADFVICLYNPASRHRPDYLRQACERILKYRHRQTVCGLACQVGRPGEAMKVLSLEQLIQRNVDMFTTVYIGNSKTEQIGDYMVTPRGYRYGG